MEHKVEWQAAEQASATDGTVYHTKMVRRQRGK